MDLRGGYSNSMPLLRLLDSAVVAAKLRAHGPPPAIRSVPMNGIASEPSAGRAAPCTIAKPTLGNVSERSTAVSD